MSVYIAFLRGINVGGRGSLPMKELVSLLETLGAADVRTVVQSGNAVFRASGKPDVLARRLTAAILNKRGFSPHVLVLEKSELESMIAANPYPEIADAGLHFGFLDSAPKAPDLSRLAAAKAPSERFKLIGRVFYLHAPDGIGRSKLAAAAEKALGVPMTDRNWNTVAKVRALAGLSDR